MPAKTKTVVGGSVAAVLLAAAGFIKPWESPGGKPDLIPYIDIVGVATVCYGETNVPMRKYTAAECDALLRKDVARRFEALDRCITKTLTVNQYAAVLSLSYNAGISAVCGSTLVRKINEGQPPSSWCLELLRWNRAGGKVVKGLTNRRQAELELCLRAN